MNNLGDNFGNDLVETLGTILDSCFWTIWWNKVLSGETAMYFENLMDNMEENYEKHKSSTGAQTQDTPKPGIFPKMNGL